MGKYTISKEITDIELKNIYEIEKKKFSFKSIKDLDYIFEIALKNRDRFPSVNIKEANPQKYIENWINRYIIAIINKPSLKIANPKLGCNDPAVKIIVQKTQNYNEQEIEIGEKNHNLFMSAENIQGHLLEEYIASKIYKYGFLWCAGNILRAIDFCNRDGSIFLQVKNKYNTENSSSCNIREGTKILKWYRLGVETKKNIKMPLYKWEELNEIINQNNDSQLSKCNMSENDYLKFLKEKSKNNPKLITEL